MVLVDRQSWAAAKGSDEVVLGCCRGEAEQVALQRARQHHSSLPAFDSVGHHLHGRGQERAGVMQCKVTFRDVAVPIHHDGPWQVGHFGRIEADAEPDLRGTGCRDEHPQN